jgi:hypothetical protein
MYLFLFKVKRRRLQNIGAKLVPGFRLEDTVAQGAGKIAA